MAAVVGAVVGESLDTRAMVDGNLEAAVKGGLVNDGNEVAFVMGVYTYV